LRPKPKLRSEKSEVSPEVINGPCPPSSDDQTGGSVDGCALRGRRGVPGRATRLDRAPSRSGTVPPRVGVRGRSSTPSAGGGSLADLDDRERWWRRFRLGDRDPVVADVVGVGPWVSRDRVGVELRSACTVGLRVARQERVRRAASSPSCLSSNAAWTEKADLHRGLVLLGVGLQNGSVCQTGRLQTNEGSLWSLEPRAPPASKTHGHADEHSYPRLPRPQAC